MRYSYNKLWKRLIDENMTRTQMRKKAGLSTNILARMGKEEPVSMKSLARIALLFDCGLDDIVEIIPDETTKAEKESQDSQDEIDG